MKIAAIPTMYAGVQFRSRLEARWAAFFDLVGLKWDYEPFDLAGWIPDFKVYGFPLLRRARLLSDSDMFEDDSLLMDAVDVLVEVKPVTLSTGMLAMAGSADDEVLSAQRAKIGSEHDADIVVLGLQPQSVVGTVFEYHVHAKSYTMGCDGVAPLHDCFTQRGKGQRRIWGQSFWYVPWPKSSTKEQRENGDEDCGIERMRTTWAAAGNLVQYKSPRGR